jgi:hypothetical protein
MPGHYREEASGRVRADEAHVPVAHSLVRTGSGFALGLITGLFLKRAAKRMYERTRERLWHGDYERTVTYDENLPDSLSRREPLPQSGQPRYGGTGAIGVSPAAVLTAQPKGSERPR